ncbi:MAG TPA: 30S ribosomal protein S17 [Verrucomicrobiae bacterium]|jgi:small subunit ribosomal protein S17
MPEATSTQPPAPAAPAPAAHRGHRKERLGKVIGAKMAKTIIVQVQRRFPHPQYKKVVTAFSKYYAHDEKSEAKVGDLVLIHETRPLSKLKRWRLTQVVERSAEAPAHAAA